MKKFTNVELTPEQQASVDKYVAEGKEKYKDIDHIICETPKEWRHYLIYESDLLDEDENNEAEKLVIPLEKEGWDIFPIRGRHKFHEPKTTWMGYYAMMRDTSEYVTLSTPEFVSSVQKYVQVDGPFNKETALAAYDEMLELFG